MAYASCPRWRAVSTRRPAGGSASAIWIDWLGSHTDWFPIEQNDANTRLVIAESETGSGKTESALDWFFKLFAAGLVDGLYPALPTRVAARELYHRVHQTIARWFPDPADRPVTLLAVPGYARVDDLPATQLLPDGAGTRWHDDAQLRWQERRWAGEHPKRFLAATVAVGSIDQALLSAVQTAHAHLRSVLLDRSLLVVDEVHASDLYMSRLLQSLLDHHLGSGGRAMLLSATLGAAARCTYLAKAGADVAVLPVDGAVAAPYPALTLADGQTRAPAASRVTQKTVRFDQVPLAFEPDSAIARLLPSLRAGARVLVVLNTVDRAIGFLRAAEGHPQLDPAWPFCCQGVICPHHGRFAPEDRLLLDQAVSGRLGRHSSPGPLLLIGTQSLEQSLDIDADLLVTDLAPADVLLQRVGRLHRHQRERPAGCRQPRCLVLVPPGDLAAGLDARGRVCKQYQRIGYGNVHEHLRTLELTRRVLHETPVVSIPQE